MSMITLRNIKKVFPSKSGEVLAVNGINLDIDQGEIFGIIGYSGAGKSTLIRMFNQLERSTGGSIIVSGRDMSSIRGKELRAARQEIGMIFQHFNLLWSRTVRENIAFPLEIAGVSKQKRAERVEELINLVGLTGREDAFPSELSGGQKQRVGIARALANNPKVLLCDEATSALDPETTDSILDLLVDINKRLGLTIVLITHEMHVIRKISHKVAVMENGVIVEQGDVLSVFKNPQELITKKFVGQLSEPQEDQETVGNLLGNYPNGRVVKLTFIGEGTEQPVISNVIRKFDITVNILQGKISQLHNGAYGTLIIHIDGGTEEVGKAISYMNEQSIGVEVITNA